MTRKVGKDKVKRNLITESIGFLTSKGTFTETLSNMLNTISAVSTSRTVQKSEKTELPVNCVEGT